jgi:hypothetical protein
MKMNAYPEPMMSPEHMPAEDALAQGASLENGLSGRARIRTDMDLEEATRSICVMPKRER